MLTRKQIARKLGVHVKTIDSWTKYPWWIKKGILHDPSNVEKATRYFGMKKFIRDPETGMERREARGKWTTSEVSEITGLSDSTIRGYVTSGKVSAKRCGHFYMFTDADVAQIHNIHARNMHTKNRNMKMRHAKKETGEVLPRRAEVYQGDARKQSDRA